MPARSARRVDALALVEPPGSDAPRELDLTGLRWLDPLHLVGVAAAAQLAMSQGSRLRLTGLNAEQAGYAARMHLGRLLDEFGAEHALPVVRERDLHDRLLEVCELRTREDVRVLAELVFDRVAADDPAAAHALHLALAEVGSNVCEHSRTVGFMAAQTIPELGVLRFAVADAGVGLFATLACRGATDDSSALNMALSGTSSSAGPGHGTGLPTTVAIVSELGGQILLASGTASTTATARGRVHRQLVAGFTGTIFEGSVPANGDTRRPGALYGSPLR